MYLIGSTHGSASDIIQQAQDAKAKSQVLAAQSAVLKKQSLEVLCKAVRVAVPWLDTGQIVVELNVKDGQLMSSYIQLKAKTGGD